MRLMLLGFIISGLMILSAVSESTSLFSGRTVIGLNSSGSLVEISDRDHGYSFLAGTNPAHSLWSIELRSPDGDGKSAVTLHESDVKLAHIIGDRKRVVMTWTGLAVSDEPNALDVTVTITAMKDSMTDWRIHVDSRSRKLGVWLVKFPKIVGLSVEYTGQAAVPFGMGQIFDDPIHDTNFGFDGIYPSCLYSMQFASISDKGSCLYLATHDPKAYVKGMRLSHTQDAGHISYEITQMPPNMGVPGQNYTQPYPCVVGILTGDWVNAAKFYRKWVLANSDWMKGKKPLAKRTDISDSMKRMPYWAGFHGMTDENMEKIEADIKNVGTPAAVHMYHWHQIPFDHRYPEFWPPYSNVRDYVEQLHSLGAKAMPYINLRLMDRLSDSWSRENASQYAATGPDGVPITEIEDNERQMGPMCPATSYWQNRFNDLAVKMTRDLNVDGIYCDQVAAMPPALCFNPNHGHPLGGGCYWVSGYKTAIQNIRKSAASVKKNVFLTTESAAEPYDFDLYLRCNEGAPFLTPIWQMVYSGYRLSFGFFFYEEREWIAKFATQYLWGVQIGWNGTPATEQQPETTQFKRECAQARYAASDYMALGEMLRAPKLIGDFARYTTTWRNFGSEIPIDWPSVQGSLWKAPDGSLGLALINLHTELQQATFEVDRRNAGIGKGDVKLSSLYPAGVCADTKLSGEVLKSTITLPARSAVMLVLRAAK